jgi:phage-related tail protein
VVKKLKFWATGTESAPPGFAVVGENGPELVQMNGGERIYPAGETSSILSSIMGGLQSFMGGGSLGGSNGLTIHNMITAPVVIDGRQTARAVYENWDKVAR